MGTPFGTDERLSNFSDLTETITFELIKVLAENYKAGKLTLGKNITDKFSKKEVFFTRTDSEFENNFLTFKYKNTNKGNPYEMLFESRGIDSPTELKIELNENLVNKLPKKMISELSKKLHEL